MKRNGIKNWIFTAFDFFIDAVDEPVISDMSAVYAISFSKKSRK
jgi:hypothetical protein